jgi:hypothetical protein
MFIQVHNSQRFVLFSNHFSLLKIEGDEITCNVACVGEIINTYQILVGKSEETTPLSRPRRRWEDIIKLDLKEVGCEDIDWIPLIQDKDHWPDLVRKDLNFGS